jgi:hypothetical protein
MRNRKLSIRVNTIRPRLFTIPSLIHVTADKREIKDLPELPHFECAQYRLATFLIDRTSYEIVCHNRKMGECS